MIHISNETLAGLYRRSSVDLATLSQRRHVKEHWRVKRQASRIGKGRRLRNTFLANLKSEIQYSTLWVWFKVSYLVFYVRPPFLTAFERNLALEVEPAHKWGRGMYLIVGNTPISFRSCKHSLGNACLGLIGTIPFGCAPDVHILSITPHIM